MTWPIRIFQNENEPNRFREGICHAASFLWKHFRALRFMKILLINPYWAYPYSEGEFTYNRIWPPLCLASCAALLEHHGFSVEILDAHAQRIMPEKTAAYASGFDKVFITSSPIHRWMCPNIDIRYFIETVKALKTITDEVYVMGHHGTVEPEKILEATHAKAVIRGEPEHAVLEISRGEGLHKIRGITFKDGPVTSNPPGDFADMKALCAPAFHLLDFKKYFYEILGNNFSLFEISRGCDFSCKFCSKVMYGEGVRTKSAEQVLREVSVAIEKHHVRNGCFADPNFLSNRQVVENLCDFLIEKKYKFKWTCQTRLDSLDERILRKMKLAGCQLIHMGGETGLQGSLDYLNKGTTLDRAISAVKLCRKAGIQSLVFFLFGLPGETDQDRKDILKHIKTVDADFISLHRIIPYKGTRICGDELVSKGVDEFISKAIMEYYWRPSRWLRTHPRILLRGFRLFCAFRKALK